MSKPKMFGGMLAAALAVLALNGCGQASARSQSFDQPRRAQARVAESEVYPVSDAEADNGPGCSETALSGQGQQLRSAEATANIRRTHPNALQAVTGRGGSSSARRPANSAARVDGSLQSLERM